MHCLENVTKNGHGVAKNPERAMELYEVANRGGHLHNCSTVSAKHTTIAGGACSVTAMLRVKHRQPILQAAQAQATSYTRSASTGNASTGNQLYRQRKHRQPVIQAAQAQATSYTRGSVCLGPGLPV